MRKLNQNWSKLESFTINWRIRSDCLLDNNFRDLTTKQTLEFDIGTNSNMFSLKPLTILTNMPTNRYKFAVISKRLSLPSSTRLYLSYSILKPNSSSHKTKTKNLIYQFLLSAKPNWFQQYRLLLVSASRLSKWTWD